MTVPASGRTAGAGRIGWAERSMPVLAQIRNRLAEQHTLAGMRVGLGLVLEPKTANLALALRAAGAEVSLYCPGHSTMGPVARALADAGLRVFAEEGATPARDVELAHACLDTEPGILLDDGAELIRLAHRDRPRLTQQLRGAAEETTSGVRPLRAMHESQELQVPVIAVNDAATKYLFDNVYGTGQSSVMALLDLTNLQLAGRLVAVVGYGWVGQGVARHVAALGGRVVVSEIDAIRALQAAYDGHQVSALTDIAEKVEVVFACTGLTGAVTPDHVRRFPDETLICTAGGGPFELPMDYLNSLGSARTVRFGITEYVRADGTCVRVVADGDCLNCSHGEGNPIEVMDLSLSLQALAAEEIATTPVRRAPGVYPIDRGAETSVAAAMLTAMGGTLEPLTDELTAAMHRW